MDFNEATDRATSTCITLADIATASGVTHHAIRRARVDPAKDAHRKPPEGWEPAIARLARDRAAQLAKLAEELEG